MAAAPGPVRYLVVGGGVAGVSCAEELCRVDPTASVTLVSGSSSARGVTNFVKLTDALESFDVEDVALSVLQSRHDNLKCRVGIIAAVDYDAKVAYIADGGGCIAYDRMCVCTGAAPRPLVDASPLVLCIRDTETISDLVSRLVGARRVVIVGNGGIALSMIHEVRSVDLVWAVRDRYIGSTFFDASAAEFFLGLAGRDMIRLSTPAPTGRSRAESAEAAASSCAPRWWWRPVPAEPIHDSVVAPAEPTLPSSILPGDSTPGVPTGAGSALESLVHGAHSPWRPTDTHASVGSATLHSPAGAYTASSGALPPRDAGRRSKRARTRGPAETPATMDPLQGDLPHQRRHVHGSSLGPALVDTLRSLRGLATVKAEAAAAAFSVKNDNFREPCAIAPPGCSPHPVFVETSVDVVALRFRDERHRWERVTSAQVGRDAYSPESSLPPHLAVEARADWHEFCGGSVGDAAASGVAASSDAAASALPWPVQVLLSNGRIIGCDFVISAIGVDAAAPNSGWIPAPRFQRSDDAGGLVVNRTMQTSGHRDVYAAGDAATIRWPVEEVLASKEGRLPLENPSARRPLWFQMRLWNAARVTGAYAARCMARAVDPLEGECGGLAFELFAHVTRLLGFKVVLLGLFNGQGLGPAYEAATRHLVVTSTGLVGASPLAQAPPRDHSAGGADPCATSSRAPDASGTPAASDCVQVHVRVTPGSEYVKAVLLHGRLVGAMLVGETDLEETFENLILNRLDLTGVDLLHPDADLEGFFD